MEDSIGACRLLLGPMFAKKSTRLIEELNTLTDLGKSCLFINHSDHGNRLTISGDKFVSSHHSQYSGLHSHIEKRMVPSLSQLDVDSFDIIGVDEGQFFDDLDRTVREWIFKRRKIVIVASLDGDSDLKPFGQAHDLECICEQDSIIRLTSFCEECLSQGRLVNASFTVCTTDKQHQKMEGGSDIFRPACMKCYLKQTE